MAESPRVLLPVRDPDVEGPVVFLGGPIQGADDWQAEAINRMHLDPLMGHVTYVNPRSTPAGDQPVNVDFHYEGQVDWESRWLNRASQKGVVMFWMAPEDNHFCHRAYGQTSRWELAEWKERLKGTHPWPGPPLVVGIDPGFPGGRYMRLRLSQDLPHLRVLSTLEETVTAARSYILQRFPGEAPPVALPYESTCTVLRAILKSHYPTHPPTPELRRLGGCANPGYLLWMMDQLQTFPDVGKRARWMGWVLAHVEMLKGDVSNEVSRNLIREDVKAGRE